MNCQMRCGKLPRRAPPVRPSDDAASDASLRNPLDDEARCGSSTAAMAAHLARRNAARRSITLRPLHHRGNSYIEPIRTTRQL